MILLATLTSNAFAYLPISRWTAAGNAGQTNVGSYQNDATRGMFYNELDIISANPVELNDFKGSNLYTSWSNLRNYAASNATNPTPLSWSTNTNNANLSVLQLGITGDTLTMFGLDGSRQGVIFQYYGGKNNPEDLGDAASAIETEYNRVNVRNTVTSATDATSIRTMTENTDIKHYTNNTVSQWNVGFAKKDLLLDDVDLGFSLTYNCNSTVLNSGGTKSFTDRYLSDAGAIDGGMPATARTGDTYNVTYAENGDDVHQNSTYATDLIAEGRYEMNKDLTVTGAIGLRFGTTINPGGLRNADGTVNNNSLEKDAMTVTASEDGTDGTTQFFDTATSIKNRDPLTFATDPDPVTVPGTVLDSGVALQWDENNTDAGTTDFSDKRTGMGPMLEVTGKYTGLPKVDVIGVFHYDTLSQPIDATQTKREYIAEQITNPAALTEVTNFVEVDYTESIKSEGTATTTNMDIGGKVIFKAFEIVDLSIGGFMRMNTVITDFSKITANINRTRSYSDGQAANNPVAGTGIGVEPGPAGGDGFGADVGAGEGTRVISQSREFSGSNEVVDTRFTIPIGVEIPLYKKKWLFRAGTQYTMQKQITTVKTGQIRSVTTETATPAGGATTIATTADNEPASAERVENVENHMTTYTYGIQWNVSKELTLAANAVLDQAANTAINATILDLDTYRNISLQAIFHF